MVFSSPVDGPPSPYISERGLCSAVDGKWLMLLYNNDILNIVMKCLVEMFKCKAAFMIFTPNIATMMQ